MVKTTFPKSVAQYELLIASSMKSFGLKTVDTKIYSFVYCSIDSVSLEEVSKGTGYSLATVSTVAKYLSDMGVLRRIKKPGTKKVFLAAQRNVSEMITQKMSAALEFVVKPKKESLPKLISNLKKKLKSEKSSSKKAIGKKYLKLLQQDLKETLFLEDIHSHILDYVKKKSKER